MTEVDISNKALLLLGAEKIISFTDGTVNSTLCNDLWPVVRDSVLRAHPWNCVVKRAQLTISTTPAWGYSYAFALPSDCLRILEIEDAVEHKIENGNLLADVDAVNIKYIYQETDPTKYDTLLVSAMAAALAAELAYPITRSDSRQDAAWKLFAEKLRLARMVDAQEDSPDTMGDFPFIDVRER